MQLEILQEENKVSYSLNRDVATTFPKPPRVQRDPSAHGSITGATLVDFTKSDFDQSILFAGLMAHACETQQKNLWKLNRNDKDLEYNGLEHENIQMRVDEDEMDSKQHRWPQRLGTFSYLALYEIQLNSGRAYATAQT
ncbi:hypothetical protein F5050DRAFT_1715192 [Lentinula boryana]|uniref:Fungal-type protein kinase domain-containing protein n=1 Tax=Lentinula boryana TaxID=40481 RepID=A0ABQ8Q243_9AGAR|nr:hypothetical protein F5050DRAFT_1715192 [Lentinula boryana]